MARKMSGINAEPIAGMLASDEMALVVGTNSGLGVINTLTLKASDNSPLSTLFVFLVNSRTHSCPPHTHTHYMEGVEHPSVPLSVTLCSTQLLTCAIPMAHNNDKG